MKIAVTGGTGFIGRYILRHLARQGHSLKAWKRDSSDVTGLESLEIEWVPGNLTDVNSMNSLVEDCDAVVHSALWKPGQTFREGTGPVSKFAEVNIVGTLNLIIASIAAGADQFVFLSTCAVYEVIMEDRALDETHPCWTGSHYGAHKAAIEKFVHSFAHSQNYNICALRPTGVFGVDHPVSRSKWFNLIQQITRDEKVTVSGGGKEIHASDVAKAVALLLRSENVAGQAFNCYDRYISQYEVATIAREISGSKAELAGEHKSPRHQIETGKIQAKGMTFGGTDLLRDTIREIVTHCQA